MLPQASDRRPITIQSFTQDLLPALLCYYATAVLVILPNTFRIRLALLPITLWAAFRAGTQVDLVAGYEHEKRLAWVNQEVDVSCFEQPSLASSHYLTSLLWLPSVCAPAIGHFKSYRTSENGSQRKPTARTFRVLVSCSLMRWTYASTCAGLAGRGPTACVSQLKGGT